MTTNRAVCLAGFVACAGITGVWGLITLTPGKVYTFVLAAGLVCFIQFKHSGNAPRHDETDPEKIQRIYNFAYAQGVAHGAERAQVPGNGGAHHTHARSAGGLPRVG